jgi:segregation and condensation protein B
LFALEGEVLNREELARAVECLLFVAEAPVTPHDLAAALETDETDVVAALEDLARRLSLDSGLQLVRIAGGYQLCTRQEHAEAVAKFLNPQKRRLGRSALEVLAIIAYRQPITAPEIQIIRGVQSEYALRVLLDKGLIEEADRKHAPGRPILYRTTQQFLHQFNLADMSELPPLTAKPMLEELS